jgi:hypothetical protein
LTNLETKYWKEDCAGLCSVPLIYLTKDLSAGRPKQTCLKASINRFKEEGAKARDVSYLSAIYASVAFLFSLPLFTNSIESEDNEEQIHSTEICYSDHTHNGMRFMNAKGKLPDLYPKRIRLIDKLIRTLKLD